MQLVRQDPNRDKLRAIELPFAKPRPYQTELILNFLRQWNSTLIHLATGGGKSIIMAYLVKFVAEVLGLRVMIVIHGIQLIEQFAEHLQRFDIKFGVIQAKHKLTNRKAKVQLCSIDTLVRRKHKPKADLIIMDEIHRIMSDNCVELYNSYDCPKAGFTATPYLKRGFDDVFDRVEWPIKFDQLAQLGFLIHPRYYVLVKIDTSKLRVDKKSDDYVAEDVELAINKKEIFSEILEDFHKHDEGKPALAFCVSIAHAKAMAAFFTDNDIPADYIDHTKSMKERNKILDRLMSGELRVVFNVDTCTTGLDRPAIEMILLCRPTKSLILFHQMVGRGTRPYSKDGYEKKHCKVLDFAQCLKEHGLVEDAPEAYFEPTPKEEKDDEFGLTECPSCNLCFRMSRDRTCPGCGHEFPEPDPVPPKDDPEEEKEESEMMEINSNLVLASCRKWAKIGKMRNYKTGFVFRKLEEEYGKSIAKRYCPYKNLSNIYEIYAPEVSPL
ncbi:MAG: DEAD/DEAH box helicase [Oligoflexales bacterium]|nr:DEAD/DEAH box helicase [Oligoflexales bacterium]